MPNRYQTYDDFVRAQYGKTVQKLPKYLRQSSKKWWDKEVSDGYQGPTFDPKKQSWEDYMLGVMDREGVPSSLSRHFVQAYKVPVVSDDKLLSLTKRLRSYEGANASAMPERYFPPTGSSVLPMSYGEFGKFLDDTPYDTRGAYDIKTNTIAFPSDMRARESLVSGTLSHEADHAAVRSLQYMDKYGDIGTGSRNYPYGMIPLDEYTDTVKRFEAFNKSILLAEEAAGKKGYDPSTEEIMARLQGHESAMPAGEDLRQHPMYGPVMAVPAFWGLYNKYAKPWEPSWKGLPDEPGILEKIMAFFQR